MSTRAYIARVNRDGTGLYVYLGRNAYPQTAGQIPPSTTNDAAAVGHA